MEDSFGRKTRRARAQQRRVHDHHDAATTLPTPGDVSAHVCCLLPTSFDAHLSSSANVGGAPSRHSIFYTGLHTSALQARQSHGQSGPIRFHWIAPRTWKRESTRRKISASTSGDAARADSTHFGYFASNITADHQAKTASIACFSFTRWFLLLRLW